MEKSHQEKKQVGGTTSSNGSLPIFCPDDQVT